MLVPSGTVVWRTSGLFHKWRISLSWFKFMGGRCSGSGNEAPEKPQEAEEKGKFCEYQSTYGRLRLRSLELSPPDFYGAFATGYLLQTGASGRSIRTFPVRRVPVFDGISMELPRSDPRTPVLYNNFNTLELASRYSSQE